MDVHFAMMVLLKIALIGQHNTSQLEQFFQDGKVPKPPFLITGVKTFLTRSGVEIIVLTRSGVQMSSHQKGSPLEMDILTIILRLYCDVYHVR